MLRYLGQRFVMMLVSLWLIATFTFMMMLAVPGDPFTGEKKLPPETLKNLRAAYHLDKSYPEQYLYYMKNLVMLDLGPSIKYTTRTVNQIISEGFPASAQLGVQAIILSLILGLTLGVIAALRQNRIPDYTATVIAVLGVSVPSFVMAPILQKYLGLEWELLPIATWEGFEYSIMPTIALAVLPLAMVTRLMRSSMLEVLSQDYIRTARSKGLSPSRVIMRHTLRNAILPVVTIMGPLTAGILTGSFVIEKIFSIPGIGKYFVDSVTNRDYPVIMGITIFYSAFLILMNFLVDMIYSWIDPRIKVGHKEAS